MKQIIFDTYTYDELSVTDKFQIVDWYFGYYDHDETKRAISVESMWLKDAHNYFSPELTSQVITDFINKYDSIFSEHFTKKIFYFNDEDKEYRDFYIK